MTGLAARDVYQLRRSRAFCETLTRSQARNFYYGLKLLPEPKRSAMFALYSYMRLVDDIADDEDGRTQEQRLADLDAWRIRTHTVLDGDLEAVVQSAVDADEAAQMAAVAEGPGTT